MPGCGGIKAKGINTRFIKKIFFPFTNVIVYFQFVSELLKEF